MHKALIKKLKQAISEQMTGHNVTIGPDYEVLDSDNGGFLSILMDVKIAAFSGDDGDYDPDPITMQFDFLPDDDEWALAVGSWGDDWIDITRANLFMVMYYQSQLPIAQQQEFRAAADDCLHTGIGIMKGNKRIDPAEFYQYPESQQQEAEPVAYRHEILEPGDDRAIVMHSESAENPWGHWMSSHLGECVYQATPLFLHPPKPAAQPVSVATRDRVMDAVAGALGNAYDCCRAWQAWSYGTMGEDDFELVSNDINRLAEIADAAIGAMAAQPQVPEGCPSDIEVREAVADFMKDTQTLPLEDCAKLLVMRIKALLAAAKEEGK